MWEFSAFGDPGQVLTFYKHGPASPEWMGPDALSGGDAMLLLGPTANG